MNTLELIERHGLSVRRIPFQTRSRYHRRHYRPGMTLVVCRDGRWVDAPMPAGGIAEVPANEHVYVQEIRVPEHAGWWMTQSTDNSTSCTEYWSKREDCLAPTLAESVQLWVEKNGGVA